LDLTEWAARWNPAIWRDVLNEGPGSADIMERIREATRTGRPVGSTEFIEGLEAKGKGCVCGADELGDFVAYN
jgi:hypothetical protein